MITGQPFEQCGNDESFETSHIIHGIERRRFSPHQVRKPLPGRWQGASEIGLRGALAGRGENTGGANCPPADRISSHWIATDYDSICTRPARSSNRQAFDVEDGFIFAGLAASRAILLPAPLTIPVIPS